MKAVKSEVLFMSSFPPNESSLATYTFNLINSIRKQFSDSFEISVCALEKSNQTCNYSEDVKYSINTYNSERLIQFANEINSDEKINVVHIEHDFKSFGGDCGENILYFLYSVFKPVVITFHEVIADPDERRNAIVKAISSITTKIIVLTKSSKKILVDDYGISEEMIEYIPYGIYPSLWLSKDDVKENHALRNKMIITSSGAVNHNSGIDQVLDALPELVADFPGIIYRIIGEIPVDLMYNETETYRDYLSRKIRELNLENNVEIINRHLEKYQLTEYLRQTDIYLCTAAGSVKEMSNAFANALSCGCVIVSTPIPQALEVLNENTGELISFDIHSELPRVLNKYLSDADLRKNISINAFSISHSASWMNTGIAHAKIYQEMELNSSPLEYNLPEISLDHVVRLTSNFGMIQNSVHCLPDVESGFTLDDNTRALIAVCMHFEMFSERTNLGLIERYTSFIENCQKPDGSFINYIGDNGDLLLLNEGENLDDSNGRAMWALGYLNSNQDILPAFLVKRAEACLKRAMSHASTINSPRAKAFVLKGLWYYANGNMDPALFQMITNHADWLVNHYMSQADVKRTWYEGNLAYANCVLPEALLLAYQMTGKKIYKDIAIDSFDYVLKEIFSEKHFKLNHKNELLADKEWNEHGEQPIDVAYAIIALEKFYNFSGDENYLEKMKLAFSWFLGNNHLGQMIYNPVTGGCFDGLLEKSVVLNQGAESTVCYLMARIIMERNNARLMSINHANEISSMMNKKL